MGLPETIPSLLAAKNLKSLIALSSQFYDKFRIVEANVGKDALEIYNRGHIDRAVYFDTMECVQTTPLLPRNVPNRECFKDYVGSLGISNKHHLIFYDRSPFGFYASPRLWWLFKYYGHEKVSVLNGGLRLWLANNYELSDQTPKFAKEKFSIEWNENLGRDFSQVNRNSATNEEQLVDVRGPGDFENGHIPQSINVPYQEFFDKETGGLKNKEKLKTLFEESGVDVSKPIIGSCMTGMTACTAAFAANQLGNKNTSVYYGSWTEYSQRKN